MSASCRKVWKYGNIPSLSWVGIFMPILKGWGFLLQFGGEIFLMLKNKTSNTIIVQNVRIADSFFKRLKGLMFTKELSPESALYIYPCSAIHTFFMNYSIDVLYLDTNNTILAIDEDMKPGKVGKPVKNAVAVVELVGGKAKEAGVKVGQTVELN
jgi:uncharacterized protein